MIKALLRVQLASVLVVAAAVALAISPSADAGNQRYFAPAGACAHADDPSVAPAAARSAMLCLVNFARRARGLSPLAPSRLLDRAAALKVASAIRCDSFSHTPCGEPVERAFDQAGYTRLPGWTIGENLAVGYRGHTTPRLVLEAWLDSPAHRRVLFTPGFRELGVCVAHPRVFLGEPGSIVWAAAFGLRP